MIEARVYLVAYDVACAKRWRRVVKLVKPFCQRSQLSVFMCRSTPARILRLQKELKQVMHHRDDRLMILDLGVAGSASAKMGIMNPIMDMADMAAAVL